MNMFILQRTCAARKRMTDTTQTLCMMTGRVLQAENEGENMSMSFTPRSWEADIFCCSSITWGFSRDLHFESGLVADRRTFGRELAVRPCNSNYALKV